MEARDFLEIMAPPNQPPAYRLGEVAALSLAGAPYIRFDGEDDPGEKPYSYLGSYAPLIGDRVLLARGFGSYVVFGKIKF